MEYPRCNLCGSEEKQVLYANQDWQTVAGDDYHLVQCSDCGLIYLYPRPSVDEIGRFYEELYPCYKQSVDSERHALIRWARKRNLANRRKQVERASGRKTGAVLDVGCATGLFLHEMKQAGWEARGVEPVASAAHYAREVSGVDVFEGYFQDAPFPANSFDVITFWDVIEHTFSPQQELQRAAQLLKPGGTLIMNIPNWNSLDRKALDAYWMGLDPPRHLYVFPRRAMERLIEKAGLRVVRWSCLVSSYYAFAISVERWMQAKHAWGARVVGRFLNFPGVRFLFEPWMKITDLLKISSEISVIARKGDG
jgi:SAM-dependent methyltransferase